MNERDDQQDETAETAEATETAASQHDPETEEDTASGGPADPPSDDA